MVPPNASDSPGRDSRKSEGQETSDGRQVPGKPSPTAAGGLGIRRGATGAGQHSLRPGARLRAERTVLGIGASMIVADILGS